MAMASERAKEGDWEGVERFWRAYLDDLAGLECLAPAERTLAPGDFVTLDFGARLNGYCSDITRTVVLGEPTDEQRKVYGIVQEAMRRAIEAADAGCEVVLVEQHPQALAHRHAAGGQVLLGGVLHPGQFHRAVGGVSSRQQNFPPGFSTLCASCSAAAVSGMFLIPKETVTASKEFSG